jgi:hypothetical protein
MPYSNPYSVLTDGTTTITFADGAGGVTNWPLIRGSWAPALPAWRDDQLGGHGYYQDVVEEFAIDVRGATASEALANLASLNRMLDQAERWADREEGISPVLYKYRPQGSTLGGPLQAVCLGRPPGGRGQAVGLPVKFNDVGMYYEVHGVKVRFLHRPWVLSEYAIDNPVANSSFESWSAGVPVGWSAVSAPVLTQSTSNVQHGTYSCRIQNTGAVANRGIQMDVSGLTVGATYTLSVYATVVAGTSIRVGLYDGGGFVSGTLVSATTTGRVTVARVVPGSGQLRIFLAVNTATTGDAYFDAVRLDSGTTVNDYHPLASEQFIATSGSLVNNPNLTTCTWLYTHPNLSPAKVEILSFGSDGTATVGKSMLLLAPSTSKLNIFEAETLTAAGFTSVADAAGKARGGSVLRYTPASTAFASAATLATSMSAKRFFIVAAVRNNSAVATFRLKATMSGKGMSSSTSEILVDNSTTNPQIVALGVVSTQNASATYSLQLSVAASTTVGPPTLDIDYIAVLALDTPLSQVLSIDSMATSFLITSTTANITLDHQNLTGVDPQVLLQSTSTNFVGAGYRGDPYVVTSGTTVVGLWLATVSTFWCQVDTVLANAITGISMKVTRQLGYLSPQ